MIFSSPKAKSSNINKTYINIGNGQKFKLSNLMGGKYEQTWSDTENTSVKHAETNDTSLLPDFLLITPFNVEITVVVVV